MHFRDFKRALKEIQPRPDLDSILTDESRLEASAPVATAARVEQDTRVMQAMQREIFHLKRELSAIFAQFNQIRDELAVKEQSARQLHVELAHSQQRELELRHQVEVLQRDLSRYEHIADDLIEEKHKNATLTQQLKSAASELNTTKAFHDVPTEADPQSQLKIELLTEKYGQASSELVALRAELVEKTKDASRAQVEAETLRQAKELLELRCTGIDDQVRLEVENRVEQAVNELETKIAERLSKQVDLGAATRLEVLEDSVQSLTLDLERSHAACAAKDDELAESKLACTEALQESSRLSAAFDRLTEEYNTLLQAREEEANAALDLFKLRVDKQTQAGGREGRVSATREVTVCIGPARRLLIKENLPPVVLCPHEESDSSDFLEEPVRRRSRSVSRERRRHNTPLRIPAPLSRSLGPSGPAPLRRGRTDDEGPSVLSRSTSTAHLYNVTESDEELESFVHNIKQKYRAERSRRNNRN